MNDTNDTILKKAQYYKLRNQYVHIVLDNGKFHNGYIIEINTDFLLFDDRMLGQMPIYFLEIKEIEKYRSDGE